MQALRCPPRLHLLGWILPIPPAGLPGPGEGLEDEGAEVVQGLRRVLGGPGLEVVSEQARLAWMLEIDS